MDEKIILEYTEFVPIVTGRYHWLVQPLISLYKKYFDVPLTFFSDRPIDIDHKVIEAFPLGCELYKKNQGPVGKMFKDALRQIDKPIIGIIFMDFLPKEIVNIDKLRILEKFMLNNKVARGNLYTGPQEQIKHQELIEKHEDFSIFKVDPFNQHIGQIGSTSLLPALWSKDFLIEFTEDNWTLDAIELPGQRKFNNLCADPNYWYSIGTYPALLFISHLCFTSNPTLAALSDVKEEDKEFVAPYIPSNYEKG